MNCYNHFEVAALGICKHCSKGVCIECLTDTGDGIACSTYCVEEINEVNKLVNHNKKAVRKQPVQWIGSGIFYIVLGIIFLLTTFFYLKRLDPFLISMGVIFIVYGGYVLAKTTRFKSDDADF